MEIQAAVAKFFFQLRLPSGINGYVYSKECVVYTIENHGVYCSKTILREIATKHKTDAQNVEHCIRTFIDKSWKILATIGLFDKKPCSRVFISRIAEYISMDLSRGSIYDILAQ